MRSSASPARPKNAACPRQGIHTRDLCLCYSQHANTIQDLSASFQLTTWGPLLGCAFWSRTYFWWWDHASRTLHDAQGVGSRNQPQNRAQSAPVLSPRTTGRLELVSISHLSQLALGCAQNFPTSAHPRPHPPNSAHPPEFGPPPRLRNCKVRTEFEGTPELGAAGGQDSPYDKFERPAIEAPFHRIQDPPDIRSGFYLDTRSGGVLRAFKFQSAFLNSGDPTCSTFPF